MDLFSEYKVNKETAGLHHRATETLGICMTRSQSSVEWAKVKGVWMNLGNTEGTMGALNLTLSSLIFNAPLKRLLGTSQAIYYVDKSGLTPEVSFCS